MGLLKLHKLCQGLLRIVVVVVVVMVVIHSVESTVIIRFDRAPPALSRFSTAVFRYSIIRTNGSTACNKHHGCSINCELDGQTLGFCPAGSVVLRNLTENRPHSLLLNVTTSNGEMNSSAYKWFIDTIPPTASISSERNYTNAARTTIDISFSEPCTGLGGFKCMNSSICDVIVSGPARVDASTLHMIKPYTKYSLVVDFSSESIYGRVDIKMANNFCTDRAGNRFTRTNGSDIVVHFDRRPVQLDLRTSVPSYELEINKVLRTVRATNEMDDLGIFLDFSDPIMNSTKEISTLLHANAGEFVPIHSKTHGNRHFVFKLRNVSKTEIVMVRLQANYILGRSGTPVSAVSPIAFMYDSIKPSVKLTTKSSGVTKESIIVVIVEFTKPVFGFQTSAMEIGGGRITRFEEHSKAIYSLAVSGTAHGVISVLVPEGKVNDVSGNPNLASNRLEVRQYTSPAISLALHSFVTAGLLATSVAAAVLSLASANLGAIGASTSGTRNLVVSDPSMNLLGMVGHLQVFVLSDWISVNLPIEYSETTKGLRWLIPREKIPWKKEKTSVWGNEDSPSQDHSELLMRPRNFSRGLHYGRRADHPIKLRPNTSVYTQQRFPSPTANVSGGNGMQGDRNTSMRYTPYGLPLTSREYSMYFFGEEPLAAYIERMENYTGWEDLEMNLVWLAMAGGGLVIVHILILLFLRWRTGTSVHGMLSVPRFELFLLILMIPCIAQSSAFVIRGGTTGGIITGALLLALPTALILSVCLFLTIAIFNGGFVQYKEIKHIGLSKPWHTKLLGFFIGWPTMGKWFYREGLPLSFLPRFGFLFEDRKGPPVYVISDQNDQNSAPKWIDSGRSGIGRMRVVNFDNSNEEHKIPISKRLLGCARSAYLVLDLLRRVCLGIISGVYSSPRLSQSLIALSFTGVQLLCLFTLKPYITRGVHVVESISLLCETALFTLCFYVDHLNPTKERTVGIVMLALLCISFLSQLVNEWYALVRCLLRLPQSSNPSFKLGLKSVAKGLFLPFLPRKYWSKLVPESSRPNTGLVPVIPLSPETEMAGRDNASPRMDSLSAMTATIVPMSSPGSPSLTNIQARDTTAAESSSGQRASEEKRQRVLNLETTKGELRKLRELAKASFSGSSNVE